MRRIISHVIYISTPFFLRTALIEKLEMSMTYDTCGYGPVCTCVCIGCTGMSEEGCVTLIRLWGCRGVVSPLWEPLTHKTNLCRLAATVCIAYTVLIYFRTLITCLLEFLCEYTYNPSVCNAYYTYVLCIASVFNFISQRLFNLHFIIVGKYSDMTIGIYFTCF